MLMVHGAEAGDGAIDWMGIKARWPLFHAVTDAGYVMVSADLGGSRTWGNGTAMNRITDAVSYLHSLSGVAPGPVYLACQSMGGLNGLIWASRNKSSVRALSATIPVINLTDVRDNSAYQATIDAAYAGGYSQAVYGAAHNPLTLAQSGALNDVPIKLWYGDSDTLCKPQFAQQFALSCNNCEAVSLSGGHEESTFANFDEQQVVQFYREHEG
ncbi:hypothetical protein BIY45_02015 [Stenotrophomonas sp. BIIR7]|nr:hypothetical protein BIY45_02015 [Stenotrophomonas sp. BIIR7]